MIYNNKKGGRVKKQYKTTSNLQQQAIYNNKQYATIINKKPYTTSKNKKQYKQKNQIQNQVLSHPQLIRNY